MKKISPFLVIESGSSCSPAKHSINWAITPEFFLFNLRISKTTPQTLRQSWCNYLLIQKLLKQLAQTTQHYSSELNHPKSLVFDKHFFSFRPIGIHLQHTDNKRSLAALAALADLAALATRPRPRLSSRFQTPLANLSLENYLWMKNKWNVTPAVIFL